MKIVLATRNRNKVLELRRLAVGLAVDFGTLDEFPGAPEIVEDGLTFAENADKKALGIWRHTGRAALADDSGLEVGALGGAPGVHSARFAGEGAGDRENVRKLLANLAGVGDSARGARFVCLLSWCDDRGRLLRFRGEVEGRILREPRGAGGFGYDPVFCPLGENRTFAEMLPEEKDSLSHRGRALALFFESLQARLACGGGSAP
ncbi:MAG: RdgB/HAM1 family non-canonical purine NTP pyrophosphatase [Magnetococcales bacterium]|nr:RdgB/HAM1 family non-canonical purine NTP pyrophosphatase [Magnetococcales bacterium]MBF0156667.1 RdgB/HAM1 family non-canonical purine NTP pyrophosphatase [Magnetococcales bacterium]